MKTTSLLLALAGCGVHVSSRDVTLLRANLGVSAGELMASAEKPRLDTIAADLASKDEATHRLGEAECVLLQTRARVLGRETASALPFLVGAGARHLEQVSAELQGAVQCMPGFPFYPDKLAKILGKNAAEVQQSTQNVNSIRLNDAKGGA